MVRKILFLSLVAACILYTGCDRETRKYVEILSDLDSDGYVDREQSEKDLRELDKKISELKKEVDRTIAARYDLGVYYKMLAVEYIELEMYGPALESLEKAIEINPVSRTLFYYAGVCSAQLSKAVPDTGNRNTYLRDAEFYYKRAIELKNTYVEALFGLSVLYVFEMNRPMDAKPLLEDARLFSSGNTQIMFLLARVYAQTGDVDGAIDLYETIEETSTVETERKEAEKNRRQLLEAYYGS